MVRAVRPLRSLSLARGCARIDSRLDTAKIGSAGRVEVHHARLLGCGIHTSLNPIVRASIGQGFLAVLKEDQEREFPLVFSAVNYWMMNVKSWLRSY